MNLTTTTYFRWTAASAEAVEIVDYHRVGTYLRPQFYTSANGAAYLSPGHRPGSARKTDSSALKGRDTSTR